ncbi:MAG: HAMP domain-containing histidine kinase [Micrococcales bacterium]|nr:HAMP domain-containing histidine kinase [Micrococcales bacterium]
MTDEPPTTAPRDRGRSQPVARWWALAVAPGLVGAVLGLVRPWGPGGDVVTGRTGLVVATVGLLVSVLAVGLLWAWGVLRARNAALKAAAVEAAVADAREQWSAEAQEEHRTFLSRLDHELKNPMMAIRTSVGVLRGDGVDTDPVAVIDSQSARIATLVTDLRKLADLETAPIEVAPVAMASLIDEVVAVVRDELVANPTWGPRSIEVHLPTVPWRAADVAGDVDLLFLALYNLVHNSVKYSTPGASIVVRGMEDGAGVLVEVADTGQGIPEDELGVVWQELRRGSNARELPGSGLGLPMVRTIIKRHQGRLQLSSRLGAGTSARLWLPFAQPGAVPSWSTGPR